MPLRTALRGAHAFLAPLAALGALEPALARQTPAGAPHSIAAIVAHMAFW